MFIIDQKCRDYVVKQKLFHFFCRFVIIYHDNIYITTFTLHYLIKKESQQKN